MTVYHPRSWLAAMPANPRFYLTKAALLTEHPGLKANDIVAAQYSGPVDDTTIVMHPTINAAPLVAPLRAPLKTKKPAKKSTPSTETSAS